MNAAPVAERKLAAMAAAAKVLREKDGMRVADASVR
jgi:hypothetical protein